MYYYGDYSNRRRRSTARRGWGKGNWDAPWEQPAWPDPWKNPWEDDEPVAEQTVKQTPQGTDENTVQLTDVFSPEHLPYLMVAIRQRAAIYAYGEERRLLTQAMLAQFEQKAACLPAGSTTLTESYIIGYAISVTEEPGTGRCTLELLIGSNRLVEVFIISVNKAETAGSTVDAGNTASPPASENQDAPVEQPAAAESSVTGTTPAPTVNPKAITWTIGPKDRWNSTGYSFHRNDGSYLDMTQVYEFIQRESATNPQLAADFPFIVVPAGQPANNAPSFAIESKGKVSSYRYVFSPDYKKRWGLEKPAAPSFEGTTASLPAIVVAPGGIRLHATPSPSDNAYLNKTGVAATVYPSNDKLTIIAYATPENPGWVKVRMANGSEGWTEERYVSVRQPGFTYYTVKAGDTIESIIKAHPLYANAPYTTGFDRRNIAEAIALLNRTNPGIYREGESDHWFLDAQDPHFKTTRYNYDTLRVKEGTTLVLPTVAQVQALQNTALIGSRPEWMNWMIGIEKGIWGFIEGIGIGFAEAAVDMVTGIWDMISGIVTGKLFTDMIDMVSDLWNKGWEGVWEMIKGMWNSTVDSFKAAWNNPNPEEKWKFFGKIVGMILFEVVLAILTVGVGAAVSAAAKTSVLVTKLPKLVKVIDALTPEVKKLPVDKDKLVKKADVDVDVKLKKINDDIAAKKNPKAREFEKNVDDDTHKKLDDDARKEVDDEIKDDPKKDEKLAVLMAAKVIAEGADISGATIAEAMAQLFPLAAVANVRFEDRLIAAPNYSIHMIGSDLRVDPSFSSGGNKTIFSKFSKRIGFGGDIEKIENKVLNILGRATPFDDSISTRKLYLELIQKGVKESELTGLFRPIPVEWKDMSIFDQNKNYWEVINKKHVDDIISNGGDIRLIHDPRLEENIWNYVNDMPSGPFKDKCLKEKIVKLKTFQKMEYDYLISKGYYIDINGLMIK
jgi:hypothetical protein